MEDGREILGTSLFQTSDLRVCDVTVAILTKNTWTGWVLNVTYHGFIMALHYATLQELLFVISNNIQR